MNEQFITALREMQRTHYGFEIGEAYFKPKEIQNVIDILEYYNTMNLDKLSETEQE